VKKQLIALPLFVLIVFSSAGYAWHDKTHIAIAKAAGYQYWFNAAGADITKTKAGDIEEKNHFYNNYENVAVTDKMVLDQIKRYNSPSDEEGHLGAIIRVKRLSEKENQVSTPSTLWPSLHYIGDLSSLFTIFLMTI
jgi:hypothetical protein